MATSLDALEALLQFREGVSKKSLSPAMPVPNPLDPSQPHLIEGDAPTPTASKKIFGSGTNSAFSPTASLAQVVTTVPNPLAMSAASEEYPSQHHQPFPPPVSSIEAVAPLSSVLSSHNEVVTHGFVIGPASSTAAAMAHDVKPRPALEVELRTEKIRDALNSKPQRGKKRRNLNDMERVELTRTRNREHAKSTRMKKKARLHELMEMEKKYLLSKEKEVLDLCRRQRLNEFVETSGNRFGQRKSKNCSHSSSLIKLASVQVQNPQFSVKESMAFAAENSGMVKVLAYGTDLESGNPKTLHGVICVDFSPGTADISDISLYWSSPESTPSPGGMTPSVSVLSFES